MASSSNKGKLAREKINGAVTIQLSVHITNARLCYSRGGHLICSQQTAIYTKRICAYKNARRSAENNSVLLTVT